jgi:hypothetical protein
MGSGIEAARGRVTCETDCVYTFAAKKATGVSAEKPAGSGHEPPRYIHA